MQRLVQLLCLSSVYLAHHFVCKDKISLNATNLRRLYSFLYMSFTLFVLTTPRDNGPNGQHAVIAQGFDVCSRMIMSVIFMDTLTTCPWQLAISLAETGVHVMQHTGADTATFAWMQMTIFGCITTVSAVLEFWVSSHISVLLDTESMVSGFRRMLRGVSDGEVLLNEAMNICDETDCLKHLLMTQSNFKGKPFERLVVPEEIGRFREFLKQSEAESQKREKERTTTPPCLRLSLRGASDLRVGVDVWHVLMPCRQNGMRHLLALREDSEAKTSFLAPAVSVKSPESNLRKRAMPLQSLPSTSAGSSDSEVSTASSQKSATSMLQNVSELVDMTLCVDATTNRFDIEQAHLSFQRQPQSSDSSMPSLRRLVRPTDWETVRSKLKKVTDPTGSKDLRLQLVDDAKRSIVAMGRVSMYKPPRSSEDGVKLCLQLTEIKLEDKSLRDWHLAAINE
eukprot:Skav218901  [mRNA]  locus=scaffold328:354613:355968:- [translate_table: standard]